MHITAEDKLCFVYNCYIPKSTQPKTISLYRKADYKAIQSELASTDWEEKFYECKNDVNMQWNIFKTKMAELEDKYVPKIQLKGTKKGGGVPLNKSTVESIKRKHKLWNKYTSNKTSEAYRDYCKARNNVKNKVKNERRCFESKIAQDVKENPKMAWKYIKSKYKAKEGVQNLYTDPKDARSKLTETDTEKAEVLSKFFASVFVEEDMEIMPTLGKRPLQKPLGTLIITEETVNKHLGNLKEGKSPGPDQINPNYLKKIKEQITYPITTIFNTSLKHMCIPDEWKTARVSAIFKKGDKKIAGNYRPVSLTCILCKMMEKIVRDHMIEHMQNNNLFSKHQYGFINKRSTTLQLLKVMDEWTKALDQGLAIDAVYMDFQKAFDTVPHGRLMIKLESYGFDNPVLGWIRSFLEHRSQSVVINNSASTSVPVRSGVPQGSVLGPLLFVVYINDLPENITSNIYLFADDTKIFQNIRSDEDRQSIQNDLIKLQNWSDTWLLTFHPDKCKYMTVGNNDSGQERYYLTTREGNRHHLQKVEQEKDIGVIIDSKLTFEAHINEKVNKANKMAGVIRRAFQFLTPKIFVPLYKSLVRCHLDYAASVWGPYRIKDIEQIESVQRRATKYLPGFKDLPYEERLRKLNLPSLTYRRMRADMIEVFKITSNLYDKEVAPHLTRVDEVAARSGRGHQQKLYKSRATKNIRLHSFSSRIVSPWNSLPDKVANAPSLNAFKNRLDNHWKNQDMVYNYRAVLDLQGKMTPLEPNRQDVDIEVREGPAPLIS